MFKRIIIYFYVLLFKKYSIKFGTVLDKSSKISPNVSIGKSNWIVDSEIAHSSKIDSKTKIYYSKINEKVKIYSNTKLFNCEIGKYTYISDYCIFAYTRIGAFCSIGRNIHCAGANHPTNRISTHPAFYSTNKQCGYTFVDENSFSEFKEIKIGNDVWIGSNVTILGGITIGNGAIIGAGSVVTKNIPDYAIYAGNPAKLIRFRFSESDQMKINKMEWWNWSETKLKENLHLFEKKY